MRDSSTGKALVESGSEEELLEQETGKGFLLQSIKFVPYDQDGIPEVSAGVYDYSTMKTARSMRIEVVYRIKRDYGDTLRMAAGMKTATVNIPFISFALNNPTTEEVLLHPAPGIFNSYCPGKAVLKAFQGFPFLK